MSKAFIAPPITLAAAVAALTLLPAQAGAAERTGMLEEIVVTARKKEESLQDLPLSVTAMTGNQLRETMVSNMEDAQHGMANVNFAVRLGSAVPTIRGVGFSILNNGTSVFYILFYFLIGLCTITKFKVL